MAYCINHIGIIPNPQLNDIGLVPNGENAVQLLIYGALNGAKAVQGTAAASFFVRCTCAAKKRYSGWPDPTKGGMHPKTELRTISLLNRFNN